MNVFAWIAAVIVIATLFYISFIQTIRDWILSMRRREAVSLLPEREGRKWSPAAQIAFILLGIGLFIVLIYFAWIPLLALPESLSLILKVIGLIIYILGFAFVEWARSTLGKNWGLSTSMQVKLLDDHQLVQSGPYAFVRNPMYFGAWGMFLGLTLLYPVWAVFILFLSTLIAFSGRARREEAVLAERFGEKWTEYKKRTKSIIPFIY